MNSRWPDRTAPPKRGFFGWIALVLCIVLAAVGALPIVFVVVTNIPSVNRAISHELIGLAREVGVDASFDLSVRLLPPRVIIHNVRIDGTDPAVPFVTAEELSFRPSLLPLLSGKIVVAQIELNVPKIHAVFENGKLTNFDLSRFTTDERKSGPLHLPEAAVAISDAEVDLVYDAVSVRVTGADVDALIEDDPELGSTFELSLQAGRVETKWPHGIGDRHRVDEDVLCSLRSRVRISPTDVLIRHAVALGSLDVDPAEASLPGCPLGVTDARRFEANVGHARIQFPSDDQSAPSIDGHVQMRGPVRVAERFIEELPSMDGWLGFDGDVHYGPGNILPDLKGAISGGNLRIEQFNIAKTFASTIEIADNVISAEKTEISLANGKVILSNTVVDPLAKFAPIKTQIDLEGLQFDALMRDLGVSEHPHVSWDIRRFHGEQFVGTLNPLKIDGALEGSTANFAVYDRGVDDPTTKHILSIKEATIAMQVSIRAAALVFRGVRVALPSSLVEGGYVSIGFNDQLGVEVPRAHVNIAELSPIGAIAMEGILDASLHLAGPFTAPKLTAEGSIRDYAIGNMPVGTVESLHASLEGTMLTLNDVHVVKGHSGYHVPSATLDFGGPAVLVVDGDAEASALSVRDFLAMWRYENDPRYTELAGIVSTQVHVHVVLGGAEDRCGDGVIEVGGNASVTHGAIFGELFDEAEASFGLKLFDQSAGINGFDLDISSIQLRQRAGTADRAALGLIIGEGRIRRGGELSASFAAQSVSIGALKHIRATGVEADGLLSATGRVTGRVDAITVSADAELTALRLRGASVGPSHLVVRVAQTDPPAKVIGKTLCGAPKFASFDPDKYAAREPSEMAINLSGDLFAGQVHIEDLAIKRGHSPRIAGEVSARGLDLGLVSKWLASRDSEMTTPAGFTGTISGDVDIEDWDLSDYGKSKAKIVLTEFHAARGEARVRLKSERATAALADNRLALPKVEFAVESPDGIEGVISAFGTIKNLNSSRDLDFQASLDPVDLSVLTGAVARVERAAGEFEATAHVTGTVASPKLVGDARVTNGELSIDGLPSDLTNLNGSIHVTESEARISNATGMFAGGTVAMSGVALINRWAFSRGDAQIQLRGIHLSPQEGLSATCNADLTISQEATSSIGAQQNLPRLGGEVTVTSFQYTRRINLVGDLNMLGTGGGRTEVSTYDPARDFIAVNLRVHATAPLMIRNNLIDVQFALDPGGLIVSGTNQRVGLRGAIHALNGGRFHFPTAEFDIQTAIVRFDDPTRISPNVDITATTEYVRYSDLGGSTTFGGTSLSRWRIWLHGYGNAEKLHLDMTSDPPLSEDDIGLLLAFGITRAELDQAQAGAAFGALGTLGSLTGADGVVRDVVPVLDTVRFGGGYSTRLGRSVPQVTLGKRLTRDIRAVVTTDITESTNTQAYIEWLLNRRTWLQATYETVSNTSLSTVSNIGLDVRWRLEFE